MIPNMGRQGTPLALGDRLNVTRENGAHLATEQLPPESSNLGKTTLKATIPPQGGRFQFDLKGPLIPPKPMPALPSETPQPDKPAADKKPSPPAEPVKP